MPCTDQESPLRRFIALQKDSLIVLGPRRVPPVPCPANNTDESVSILSSCGFGSLAVDDYINAVIRLKTDIALVLGDVVLEDSIVTKVVGSKRKERMVERTFSWTKALMATYDEQLEGGQVPALFAPILPVDKELQQRFLSELYENEEWNSKIKGLVLYENASLEAIPSEIVHLPRLLLSNPSTPQAILRSITAGADLFTLPFITAATDAGIAFTFQFSTPSQNSSETERLALGVNLWESSNATFLGPLKFHCRCYTCSAHHRAYIHHLLSAKEMLAWVLLQVHNHHVMDGFFDTVRESIRDGTFETLVEKFETVYEDSLPASDGLGPRYVIFVFKMGYCFMIPCQNAAYEKFVDLSGSFVYADG